MLPAFEPQPSAAWRSPATAYLARLLMREVPALRRGELDIVSIARRPGVLSKVAVRPAPSIGADHIARVRAALEGEQIHVVGWQRDPRAYISAALGLADVPPIELRPSIAHAQVFVGEIDLRGMDGWRGVNRLLASALTGWRIRLVSIAETPAWRALRAAIDHERTVAARVNGATERGLKVEVYGLFGIVPTAQQAGGPRELGHEIDVRVVRLDPDEGRIVLSERLRSRAQLRLPGSK